MIYKDPWSWNSDDYNSLSERDKLLHLASAGTLAANIHNSQPWRVHILSSSSFEVLADPSYSLIASDSSRRSLAISLGCFVLNVQVAATRLNLSIHEKYGDNGIILSFSDDHDELANAKMDYSDLAELSDSIVMRRSNKFPFSSSAALPEQLVILQSQVNKLFGDKVVFVTDQRELKEVSQLHDRAIRAIRNSFWSELMEWTGQIKTKEDLGMPAKVVGLREWQLSIVKTIVKLFPFVASSAVRKKDGDLMGSVPAIGFIHSRGHGFKEHIDSGRCYEFIALLAKSMGLSVSPMHAITDNNELSAKVISKYTQMNDAKLQMLFRIGVPTRQVDPLPRKQIEKMLI